MATKTLQNSKEHESEQLNFKDDFELIEWARNNYLTNPDSCILELQKIESTDPFILANKSNLIGIILFFRCEYYNAFELFKEAIKISRKHDLKEMETKLLVNLTSSYIRFNKYNEALELAFESLNYKFDKYNAMSYHNLAIIYTHYGEHEKSMEAKLKCKSLNEKIGEKKMVINDYFNIGDSFFEAEQFKKAIKEYNKIIEVAKKNKLNNIYSGAYSSLATTYNKLKQYKKAINAAEKGLKWAYKYDNKRDIGLSSLYKAEARFYLKEYELAEKSLEFFFKIFIVDLTTITKQAFELKINLTEKLHPNKLIEVYKEYNNFLLTDYKDNEDNGINDILKFKEQEIDAIQKKNKAIEIQNRELNIISKLLAHDLKSPIRNIGSFSNLLNKKLNSNNDEEVIEFTNFITDGAKEIYNKLDITEAYLNYKLIKPLQKVDTSSILRKLKAKNKKQNLKLKIKGKTPAILSNQKAILDLFQLLIKFVLKQNNQSKKEIQLQFIDEEKDHLIIVSDNRNGLKNAGYWFNEFFNQNNIESSGIEMGFALVRKIVMIHGGDLLLENEVKKAIKLKIWLPKNPQLN